VSRVASETTCLTNPSPDVKIFGRILVVEDNPLVRDLLCEVLSAEGHQVTTVSDGRQALGCVQKESFDLVISDIHMPGLSGLDLIARTKAVCPWLPIIIITGYPTLAKAIAAMKQGATDFIIKPFNIRHVINLVRDTLLEKNLLAGDPALLAELNNQAVIERLNRQLRGKVDQLTKFFAITESFQSVVDNSAMFQHIVELAAELTAARRVSLMSFDPSRSHMGIRAAVGIPLDIRQNARVALGQGVAGSVARQGRLVRVTSKEDAIADSTRCYESQSWLSVPLFIGDELVGVLNLTDKSDGSDFTEEDESLMLMLVEKAGIKIENNALYEGIYANLLDTLKVLVSTIEAKDPYTRHHSQRVTDTALELARYVRCSEEDCESIGFAGILHDIGKIGIQDSILLKPGSLDPAEYEIIKRHPVISDTILQPLGLIEAERDIVRHHHERIDGIGYPDQLRGDQISLLSRIVSIADAFDAMISTRSYRKAMSVSEVIRELKMNAGKQFDVHLVNSMVDAINAGQIRVRTDA